MLGTNAQEERQSLFDLIIFTSQFQQRQPLPPDFRPAVKVFGALS